MVMVENRATFHRVLLLEFNTLEKMFLLCMLTEKELYWFIKL